MMRRNHWFLGLAGLVLCLVVAVQAGQTFVFDKIKVEGSARLSAKTVQHYLPIEVGQEVRTSDLSAAVRALYRTGFFKQVDLLQDGSALIVKVQENPFIYKVHFSGNRTLSDDELQRVSAQMGLKEGQPYHANVAHQFKRAVMQQYQRKGFYNIHVEVQEKIHSNNRVSLDIIVAEGKEAIVGKVMFAGNNGFSDYRLRHTIKMRTTFWSFFSHNNRFSNEQLDADVEAIRALYLNHGYLDVKLRRPEVALSDKQSEVDLHYRIEEGRVHHLGDVKLHYKGPLTESLENAISPLKKGEVFSRKRLQQTLEKMQRILVDAGYARAQIKVDPQRGSGNVVNVVFDVFPGKLVFVHEVYFRGNARTHEEVLRREMRQFENSLLNQFQIRESERRLNNLGYLRHASCQPHAIDNRDDLVDIHCSVEEVSSATASASVGFSTQGGMLFGGSLAQSNFLGTGNAVKLKLERNRTSEVVQFSYTNPYFLSSEVSQQISLAYRHSTPGDQNVTKYKTDGYHFGLDYRWPISAYDYLHLGAKWSRVHVLDYQNAAQLVQDYISKNGDEYWLYVLHSGWSRHHLDRAIFPTQGTRQTFNAYVALPLGGDALSYYTLDYRGAVYLPLGSDGFTVNLRGQVGYGQGYGDSGHDLPFFKYFYAGGMGSVRGYRSNSLGPQDTENNSIGGNALLTATAELFFPQWLGDQYRFSAFIDGGNVFDGGFNVGTSSSGMRYAAGMAAYIRTPLIPIEMAFSVPLNADENDEKEAFAFSLGMGF